MQSEDAVVAFVEIPKGSRNKYEYDAELGRVALDRHLFTSMSYPADYGFIVDTLGEDGDPLDALILVSDPTFPGCVISVRPVAVFDMTDEKGPDQKIICVPFKDPEWSEVTNVDDISPNFRDEIEHFFSQYGRLEGKTVKTEGFGDRTEAERFIAEARERFVHEGGPTLSR